MIITIIAVDLMQAVNILGLTSTFPAGVLVQTCGVYITGAVGLVGGGVGNILVWVVGNAHAPGTTLIPCFLVAGKTRRSYPINEIGIEIRYLNFLYYSMQRRQNLPGPIWIYIYGVSIYGKFIGGNKTVVKYSYHFNGYSKYKEASIVWLMSVASNITGEIWLQKHLLNTFSNGK